MLDRPRRSNLSNAGLWRIDDDRIIAVDRTWSGPTTVLVPGEDVLTLSVDLPLKSRRQREAALPFAIEDEVGEPLALVHCALGIETSPRRHLSGVVRHDKMQHWLTLVTEAGLGPVILTPDPLSLPMPQPGRWSIRVDDGRALVRTEDGTGFAVPSRDLHTAWIAAGQPTLDLLGGTLPETMVQGVEVAETLLGSIQHPSAVLPPLDLAQGPYALVRARQPNAVRTLALIAAAGAIAHLAILSADVLALNRIAKARAAQAQTVLAQTGITVAPGEDLLLAADRARPQAGARGARPFTTLLARTSSALPSVDAADAARRLSYSGDGALEMGLAFPDALALERAVSALQAAGLTATGRPVAPSEETAVSGLNAEITITGASS